MVDRPRAERRTGMTVLYDKAAGYVRELDPDDVLALAEELVTLARIARMCEGKTPPAMTASGE